MAMSMIFVEALVDRLRSAMALNLRVTLRRYHRKQQQKNRMTINTANITAKRGTLEESRVSHIGSASSRGLDVLVRVEVGASTVPSLAGSVDLFCGEET